MGKNKTSKGVQQASTDHAPGQHGDKTTSRIAEISQTGNPGEGRTGPQYDPAELREHDHAGKNRLFEDRQQHDEADKNSEKTRLARDIDRHGHGANTDLHHRDTQSASKRKN